MLILCTWRNGLCSIELVYVFQRTQAVSSVLPNICTMNEEGCSTSFPMPKHMQQTSYARKYGVNGAPLYNVDVVRIRVHGGTCVRRVTPSSLHRTCNNKVATVLPLERRSHRGLWRATSTLYNGVRSPRKYVPSLLWNMFASCSKHVRLYRYMS